MDHDMTTTAVEAFRCGRRTHGEDGLLASGERIAGLRTLPELVRPGAAMQMRLCTREIATGQALVGPAANGAGAADRQHQVWSGLTISRRFRRPNRRSLV